MKKIFNKKIKMRSDFVNQKRRKKMKKITFIIIIMNYYI